MSEKKNLLPAQRVRAALYIRVSTQEQAIHGLSLDAQRAALEAWAKKEKVKVVGVYADEGISARKAATKRPALQRLLRDIEAGKVDLVAFTKLDRWFRNIGEYYKVQEILEAHKVNWHTIQEDYDTSTASGRIKINIMLTVAQDEADRTSERIKAIMRVAKEKGESLAGSVPLGYKRVNRRIVIDNEIAPVVRRAFEMYMGTGSMSRVIRAFPELRMNHQTFSRMLENTAYIGDFRGVPVEPLLTAEEYRYIKTLRRKVVRKTKENRLYIFSGLLVCARCGRRFAAKTNERDKKKYTYYVCPGRSRLICDNAKVTTEQAVEAALIEHIPDVAESEMRANQESGAVSHKAERDAIRRKLSRLSELYVNEIISMDDYKRQHGELQAALDAIPEDIPKRDMSAIMEAFSDGWEDVYDQLSREGKQEFWRKYIDKILIDNGKVQDIFLR